MNENEITWAEIVAAIGAIIIIARVVVKLTPTPKDNSILEKVIAFLKHIGLHVSAVALLVFATATGCSTFSTTQIDERINEKTGEKTKVTTRASARTFWDSKSNLAKWKAQQSEGEQGAEVGGLGLESSGTNVIGVLKGVADILNAAK